jgi:hypothetical protein
MSMRQTLRNVTEALASQDWPRLLSALDHTSDEDLYGLKFLIKGGDKTAELKTICSMQSHAISKGVTDMLRGSAADEPAYEAVWDDIVQMLTGVRECVALGRNIANLADSINALLVLIESVALMHDLPDEKLDAFEAAQAHCRSGVNLFVKPFSVFPAGQHLLSRCQDMSDARTASKGWLADVSHAVKLADSLKFVSITDCLKDNETVVIPAQAVFLFEVGFVVCISVSG